MRGCSKRSHKRRCSTIRAARPASTRRENSLCWRTRTGSAGTRKEHIREGLALTESALRGTPPGGYSVQAAIAAVHARAQRAKDTDWAQIAGLYDVLLRIEPTPVIELNRAVAIAFMRGPEEGLRLLDELEARRCLPHYYLLPAARGDLLRRLVAGTPQRRLIERRSR
jgi:RNA polymerase sigma-70 factor (ECF subfamily)